MSKVAMLPPEIKRILKELPPYKKQLVIVAITGITLSLFQSGNVALTKRLGDSLQNQDLNTLLETAGLMVLFALCAGISRYFHLYLMAYTGEQVVQGLRGKLQNKFMRLNLTFHNNYAAGSGGLISRILNDIVIIQNGLRMFADFFREPLTLIVLLGWLIWLNWQLTLTIIVVLPLILWFLKQISKTIKAQSIKGQQDLEGITSTIKESLDGVRIIQSFNLEHEMSSKFLRQSDEYLKSRKKIHQRVESSGPVSEFVVTLVVLGITLFVGTQIAKGTATFGDFIGYLAALLGLSPPIKKLQESYVRTQETSVAAHRVFQILDDPNEVPQNSKNLPFPENFDQITFKDVSFFYADHAVLKKINLNIKKGQVVAFVGASGSGKSTIMNLLERFFDPQEGEIWIGNQKLQDLDLKSLRKNIALVTQDVFLFSDTIERNIWAGDFERDPKAIIDAARSANALPFIEKTPQGFQTRVGDRGNLLSGGEKQRISIARAIFKNSPLLILDEATSALDTASEFEVQKGLEKLMEGRTTLVIAHRFSTISKADLIVVMKDGQIVEMGTHSELLSKGGEFARLNSLGK